MYWKKKFISFFFSATLKFGAGGKEVEFNRILLFQVDFKLGVGLKINHRILMQRRRRIN